MKHGYVPIRFACLVLAIGGLSLFCNSSANAEPPAAEPEIKDGENQVGYRKLTLTYKASDGASRERTILVWYPTSAKAQRYDYRLQIGLVAPDAPVLEGKHPVILFSHGFLGAADQTIFLTEAWARRGYIVAGTHHADSLKMRTGERPAHPNFVDAKSWTDEKFRDRREDVTAILDHLLTENGREDSFLAGHVDAARIGAAGHSLGGYTVLGMAGGWKAWHEPRIKAVLALSPYAAPYLVNGDLATVEVPMMLQGGTLDFGISPFLPKIYEKAAGPKYHLVLMNETHFGWTNLASLGKTTVECAGQGNPKLMTDYSLAFFDRHLRQRKDCEILGKENPLLDRFDFARE